MIKRFLPYSLLLLFVSSYNADAMEASSLEEPANHTQSNTAIYRDIPSLVNLTARATATSLLPDRIDETNLDATAQKIQEALGKCPQELQEIFTQKITYANPYPFYRENDDQIIGALPHLHQYIIYNVKNEEYTIRYAHDTTVQDLLFFNAATSTNITFHNDHYLSYVEKTLGRGFAHETKKFHLYKFQTNSWQLESTFEMNQNIKNGILSPDNKHIALALETGVVIFYHYNVETQSWERKQEEINVNNYIDNCMFNTYRYGISESFHTGDRPRVQKFRNTIQAAVGDAISSIAFLPTDQEMPNLLLGLYNYNLGGGTTTLWSYNLEDKAWHFCSAISR